MASPLEFTYQATLSSWTVEQLKDYLRENNLPLSGNKAELVSRVSACLDTTFFEAELRVQPFQKFNNEGNDVPRFESLPLGSWSKENFPIVAEDDVKSYLKNRGGYTKNYRTGVRLCQCGHLYDLEMAWSVSAQNQAQCLFYFKAKCRPTMRKNPPFYHLFAVLNHSKVPTGGNCSCPAGASQSCVHISALLFTLAEVTQTACTSIRCAWSRPSTGSKATFAKELDFGVASMKGYFPYNGTKPPISSLLDNLIAIGSKPAIVDFLNDEQARESVHTATVNSSSSDSQAMRDPLDKLMESISSGHDPTVSDLVQALAVTSEEVEIIQVMTIGQRNNPLWMDVRQWRITASNFGRVCNRNFRVLYPPSLTKIILGDYNHPNSPAIQWGCSREDQAIQEYEAKMNVAVDVCGIYLSTHFPYLGASPDGLMYVGFGKIAIIEVKCPYKHRNNTIAQACEDSGFCLAFNSNDQPILKRSHDYYFQVTGQLAITGAEYCDFVVWMLVDLHIERVYMDRELWKEMTEKNESLLSYRIGSRNFMQNV